ncbi:hypothetical protein BH10ACT11_BH10ACT11_20450 [soil metagenome]
MCNQSVALTDTEVVGMTVETEPVVEREAVVEAPVDEVWKAITDETSLELWLGDEVELDPVPGGDVRVRDGGEERCGEVLFVEEGERITFSWSREGADPSFVEFSLDAVGSERTLVRVVEAAPVWAPTALAVVGTPARRRGLSAAAWTGALRRLALSRHYVSA